MTDWIIGLFGLVQRGVTESDYPCTCKVCSLKASVDVNSKVVTKPWMVFQAAFIQFQHGRVKKKKHERLESSQSLKAISEIQSSHPSLQAAL